MFDLVNKFLYSNYINNYYFGFTKLKNSFIIRNIKLLYFIIILHDF